MQRKQDLAGSLGDTSDYQRKTLRYEYDLVSHKGIMLLTSHGSGPGRTLYTELTQTSTGTWKKVPSVGKLII